MAEARSAVREPRVPELDEGRDARKDFIRAWRRAFLRRFFRTRNLIRNGMWPTSIWNLGVTVSLFSILLLGDWKWAQPINSRLWYISNCLHINEGVPFLLRVFLVSFMGGVVFFIILMYKRRWLLRVLLSYRCWMYQNPRTQSLSTKAWGAVVRLISGYHPTTYSYQKSLPFLPVPSLDETLSKFLLSIKPLYEKNSAEYEKFVEGAEEFKSTLGPKLQRILVLKSWWSQNWVTDWWEKYVYLMSRSPLAINSNYYVLDQNNWIPTHRPVSRAASTIYQYTCFKRLIDRELLEPLLIRNTIPICMAQYERIFCTTRIPGEDVDELGRFPSSRHISVMRKGLYYKLDVFDVEGRPLHPKSLEKQLDWIVEDADMHLADYSEASRSLASLTGLERSEWAAIHSRYFNSGINKESIDTIESAQFHVILDTCSFTNWSEKGKYLLHGDGRTIWFDKSINIVVFSNGSYGMNTEHSWGDAPVIGHLSEYNATNEVVQGLFDKDGYCLPVPEIQQAAMKSPVRLLWDLPEDLSLKIYKAIDFNTKNNTDLDLCVDEHSAFGKGFIKTCKVSPDAFIQMALQLAYFRDAGQFALTYEASMTRLYLLGRTETVRSLTCESADFVNAMADKCCSKSEKIELLRQACRQHQKMYRDAMNGEGIDRHMFGLFVVCKGLGYESDFLKDGLMMPWTLSTSQQPQQQIASSPDCNLPQYKDVLSPGGGFGPVSDQGYGVSYMVAGENRIFFHISSKKSTGKTDSRKFMQTLFQSLDDIKMLFVEPVENGC